MEPITYHTDLEEREREAAAALYFEAFREKLGPILGARGQRLLAATLNLDRAFVARQGSQVVGVAGIEFDGRAFVGIHWAALRRTYGFLGGLPRLFALALFDRTASDGELLMDGIAVAPEARGQGIGSALLEEVLAKARELRLKQVRLDVVDTNPAARRLYERRGFVATKTVSVPWLGRWFGFSASTTMVRDVTE